MTNERQISCNGDPSDKHHTLPPDPKIRTIMAKDVAIGTVLTALAGWGFMRMASQPDHWAPVFALALSWIVIAIAVAMKYQSLVKLTPDVVRFAAWEHEGRVYKRCGVVLFRWLLLHSPLRWLRDPQITLRSGRSDLDRLVKEMEFAEVVHAIAGMASLVAATLYLIAGHVAVAIWLVLISIPLNVYPVMLQRWNRGRVLRVRRRS